MRQKNGRLAVHICAVLLFVFLSGTLFAQRKVSGTVTSAKTSQPISFATVTVKGTNVATATDIAGAFTITVPPGRSVLTITSVGFADQDVTIGNGPINVALADQVSNLDEIVVTGYTAQKKKEITGSVSVVSVKDLKAVPAGTTEQMLQGQASGVTVIGSGQPGDNSNVFIRGVTSFGNTAPLIVVDGVQSAPGDLSPLHDLSANDIESFQVLKDAQSAIYGARGASGVIIITTKRGKGKATISYDGYYGTQVPASGNVWHKADPQTMANLTFLALYNSQQWDTTWKNPDDHGAGYTDIVMKTAQYGNLTKAQWEAGNRPKLPDYLLAGQNAGVSAGDPSVDLTKYNNDYNKNGGNLYLIVPANKTGTDWFHALFKSAPMQSHTITANGGSDKSSYLFSFNYMDQQGTLLNTYLKRYGARINTLFNIKNNIRVGENLYVYFRQNPRIGNNQEGNPVNTTGWMQTIIPLYDAGGGFAGTAGSNLGNSSSPLATQVRSADNRNYDWYVQGGLFAEVDFLRHFTARTFFGGNLDNNYGFYHNYRTYENKENNPNNGYGEYANYSNNWNFTNSITYSNIIAKNHSIKIFAGYEGLVLSRQRGLSGSRIGYYTDAVDYLNLSTGDNTGKDNSSYFYNKTATAWLGRFDYNFKEKYLFSANGRRDGASVFGPKARFATTYSLSAGWVVSREEFFKNITFINSLKIRGSYGTVGNISNIPAYNQYTAYASSGGGSYYAFDGLHGTFGLYASQYGNLNTTWELNTTTDVGFDATFLKNKLDVSFDWYQKKVDGLLFQDQPVATVGVGGTIPYVNVGDLKNTGIDLAVNYHTSVNKDLSYNIGFTFTAYKNEVVRIPGASGFFTTATTHNTGDQVRNQGGHPVGAFYGYQVVGIFQDAKDVSGSATQQDAAPGRFKYLDANGDHVINDKDQVFFGDPNPWFTSGLNLGVQYKGFDFATTIYASVGNKILNYTRYFQDFWTQFQNSKSEALWTQSWGSPGLGNRKATYPIVENSSNFSNNAVLNSFYMENGTYVRCKQMSIGYNFPSAALKKFNIDKARLYVQSANLFTITKYIGLDPEVAGSAASFGVDYGNYPPSKTFIVGVNITF